MFVVRSGACFLFFEGVYFVCLQLLLSTVGTEAAVALLEAFCEYAADVQRIYERMDKLDSLDNSELHSEVRAMSHRRMRHGRTGHSESNWQFVVTAWHGAPSQVRGVLLQILNSNDSPPPLQPAISLAELAAAVAEQANGPLEAALARRITLGDVAAARQLVVLVLRRHGL